KLRPPPPQSTYSPYTTLFRSPTHSCVASTATSPSMSLLRASSSSAAVSPSNSIVGCARLRSSAPSWPVKCTCPSKETDPVPLSGSNVPVAPLHWNSGVSYVAPSAVSHEPFAIVPLMYERKLSFTPHESVPSVTVHPVAAAVGAWAPTGTSIEAMTSRAPAHAVVRVFTRLVLLTVSGCLSHAAAV